MPLRRTHGGAIHCGEHVAGGGVGSRPVLAVSLALAVALCMVGGVLSRVTISSAAPLHDAELLELVLTARIFGHQIEEDLQIVDTGDVNGDGAIDLLVTYYSSPRLVTTQDAIVLGRPDWPTEADRGELSGIIPIDFSFPESGPVAFHHPYGLMDINGDGFDDFSILIEENWRGFDARQLSVYFGGHVLRRVATLSPAVHP